MGSKLYRTLTEEDNALLFIEEYLFIYLLDYFNWFSEHCKMKKTKILRSYFWRAEIKRRKVESISN